MNTVINCRNRDCYSIKEIAVKQLINYFWYIDLGT